MQNGAISHALHDLDVPNRPAARKNAQEKSEGDSGVDVYPSLVRIRSGGSLGSFKRNITNFWNGLFGNFWLHFWPQRGPLVSGRSRDEPGRRSSNSSRALCIFGIFRSYVSSFL